MKNCKDERIISCPLLLRGKRKKPELVILNEVKDLFNKQIPRFLGMTTNFSLLIVN